MKNILTIIFISLAMRVVAQTNTPVGVKVTPATDIPSTLSAKFNIDFPNISPDWQIDGEQYYAGFKDAKTNLGRMVVYDRYGNVLRTDTEADSSAYPKNIRVYQAKRFPNESYKVWLSYDNHGNRSYYSLNRAGTRNWYDKKAGMLP